MGKVREKRSRGWFYLDDEYFNGYAKVFGPIGTSVYLALCRYVDKDQKCFPSESTIAKQIGCGERSVREYLKRLEEWNIIEIERERDSRTKSWKNNVYWLLDKSEWNQKPPAAGADGSEGEPSAADDKTQRQTHRQQVPHKGYSKDTQIKDTHIAAVAAEWSYMTALRKMVDDKRADIKIIAMYYPIKGMTYASSAQLTAAIRRDLRAAGRLKAYPMGRVWEVMMWLKDNADFKWTLETVHKYIDENLAAIGRAPQVVKIGK